MGKMSLAGHSAQLLNNRRKLGENDHQYIGCLDFYSHPACRKQADAIGHIKAYRYAEKSLTFIEKITGANRKIAGTNRKITEIY